MTEAYRLRPEPDWMLHNFRVHSGPPPKAPVYGGWKSDPIWEDINCQGHTLGHYLSACALAWRSTRAPRFKQRVDHIAGELDESQKASGVGLVCAFPNGPALIAAHLRGEKITGVPRYTLHKVFAGLRDGTLLADGDTARAVLLRLADWAVIALRPLSDAQFEAMLNARPPVDGRPRPMRVPQQALTPPATGRPFTFCQAPSRSPRWIRDCIETEPRMPLRAGP